MEIGSINVNNIDFSQGLKFNYKPVTSVDGKLWERLIATLPSTLIKSVLIIKCVAAGIFAAMTLKFGKSKAYFYCLIRHFEGIVGRIIKIFFIQLGDKILDDSLENLMIYNHYIKNYEKICIQKEFQNLMKRFNESFQNNDVKPTVKPSLDHFKKEFPNIFKEKNRSISFNILKNYINVEEVLKDSLKENCLDLSFKNGYIHVIKAKEITENTFNEKETFLFDMLLELGRDKELEDKIVQDNLNRHYDFYVKEVLEKTKGEFNDLGSVFEKIESAFSPYKNIAKAIFEKEIEFIGKSFENTIIKNEETKILTVKETGIISVLEKSTVEELKNSHKDLFHPLRKPLLEYYIIGHFTLPQEQKEDYEYDDQLVLPMTLARCKLFEILLDLLRNKSSFKEENEEYKWVQIKLGQIKNYLEQHNIDLEGCPFLQNVLKQVK